MPHTFRIEHFEGPLDLLLQLVEQEELDISNISLATVADQFVTYVKDHADIAPDELADFLVVAAKLVYLKSKLLIPSLVDEELDQGPDLETQLREYQRFVRAAKEIDRLWNQGRQSFLRQETGRARVQIGFCPPPGVTRDVLVSIMRRVVARLEPLLKLPEVSVERAISLQDKLNDLFERVKSHVKMSFHVFIATSRTKHEAIVSFLALLELVKQRVVRVGQPELFEDISIEMHENAPEKNPLAESFV